MSDQRDLSDDLVRGGKDLAKEIYGKDDPKHVRKIYHEQDKWPIFQLDDSGVLYALRSRLRAHLEAKSAEKEARIAAAAGKTTSQPPRRRRRAHPTKAA